ncbi:hypothetical protein PMAYCL1PPCAC_10271, partial [Pristionchus mayeri]
LLQPCRSDPTKKSHWPFYPMHQLILLCLSFLASITALWTSPSCQPAYSSRCQQYNSCYSSSPGEAGYAMPRVAGRWDAGRLSSRCNSVKSRKFAFNWSKEEASDSMALTGPGRRNGMVRRSKYRNGEEIRDTLLDIDSAELEKGRMASRKLSKGQDLWAGGDEQSSDWRNSAWVSSLPETTPLPAGLPAGSSGNYRSGGNYGRGLGIGSGLGLGGGGGGAGLFGISSGVGVTAPGVGPIGISSGLGIGK